MGFLYFIVDLFINTFGITRPTDQARRRAAFFILGLLILVVAGAVAAFVVVSRLMK